MQAAQKTADIYIHIFIFTYTYMQAARKTAEDVAAEMIETANQIKNQMFKTANKKLENSSRKLSTICSLS
jgi:hypothetical protein